MATYQISFQALTDLGAADMVRLADSPDQWSVGQRLALVPGDPEVILAEVGPAGLPAGLIVSPHSPFGRAGQGVSIGARIWARTLAGGLRGAQVRGFEVLCLDGKTVGLIAADHVTDPSVTDQTAEPADDPTSELLQIEAVEEAEDADRVPLTYALYAMAGVGPQPTAKPRRNPFAFALGTRIDTPDGPRRVETLGPGDLISTLDNGSQPLRWVGRRLILPDEMALREDLRPLRLEAGVLGNERALLLSPRHRVLLNDWRAQVYFGEDQVLVPAQALINETTVRQVLPFGGVICLHLLFDRHEMILSEGTVSESFHPGATGLGALDPAQREEIEALFPGQDLERRRAAFPMLRMAEARALRLPD